MSRWSIFLVGGIGGFPSRVAGLRRPVIRGFPASFVDTYCSYDLVVRSKSALELKVPGHCANHDPNSVPDFDQH